MCQKSNLYWESLSAGSCLALNTYWRKLSVIFTVSFFLCILLVFVLTRLSDLTPSPIHVHTDPSILCCTQKLKNALISSGLIKSLLFVSLSFVRQYAK